MSQIANDLLTLNPSGKQSRVLQEPYLSIVRSIASEAKRLRKAGKIPDGVDLRIENVLRAFQNECKKLSAPVGYTSGYNLTKAILRNLPEEAQVLWPSKMT